MLSTTCDKLTKLKSVDSYHKKLQLIYQWAKQDAISFTEFKFMIDSINKEEL